MRNLFAILVLLLLVGCNAPERDIVAECAEVTKDWTGEDDRNKDDIPPGERVQAWNCGVLFILDEIPGVMAEQRQELQSVQEEATTILGGDFMGGIEKLVQVSGVGMAVIGVKDHLDIPEEEKLHPVVSQRVRDFIAGLDVDQTDERVQKILAELT